jgi:RND family efflux transporter MFP subunit
MIRTFVIPAVIVLIFVAGAGALMATAPSLQPDTPDPIAVTVRVQEVSPEDVLLQVASQGSAQPTQESQLIPEVSGRVDWVSPSLVTGGAFKKGDTLLRIDSADYQRALTRAKAAMTRAAAEQENARFEDERLASLADRQLVSRSAREDALRRLRVAEAALADARAAEQQAQADLARTAVKAPFDGLVRSESVDVGQYAARGSAVASIYAADAVEVRLPISDRQLAFLDLPLTQRGAIEPGNQPFVTLNAEYAGQELSWDGHIVRTEAAIDTASRMVYLVARIDSTDGPIPLNVGLFVNAQIRGREAKDVAVLPRSALRNDNQVLVVDRENRLRFRQVSLLRLREDDVLIQDGLNAGELVCVSAIQTAIEGMNVVPIFDPASDRAASVDDIAPAAAPPPLETIEVTRADAS